MPQRKRPLFPGATALRCNFQGCWFETTSCASLYAHILECCNKQPLLPQPAKQAARGAAGQGAATSQRTDQAEQCAADAYSAGAVCLQQTEKKLCEHPAEATALGADGVVSAPAGSLVPNLQPSASAPAPPHVLGQQGGQTLAASQRPWAPGVSGAGAAADSMPVICREKPRQAARAPALTPWEAELYRELRPLPQSKQTDVLRVLNSAFPNNNRLRFTDALALKAAYDSEQVSLSPCCPFHADKLPATRLLNLHTRWLAQQHGPWNLARGLHRHLPPHTLQSWSPAPPAVCTAAFSVTNSMVMCKRLWRLVVL